MKAGFWEILLIVVLILVLFGHAKIPDMMKNLANGIKVFKQEMKGDDDKSKPAEPVKKAVAAKPAIKKKPVKKVAKKK